MWLSISLRINGLATWETVNLIEMVALWVSLAEFEELRVKQMCADPSARFVDILASQIHVRGHSFPFDRNYRQELLCSQRSALKINEQLFDWQNGKTYRSHTSNIYSALQENSKSVKLKMSHSRSDSANPTMPLWHRINLLTGRH
jgi:hypothetical protein